MATINKHNRLDDHVEQGEAHKVMIDNHYAHPWFHLEFLFGNWSLRGNSLSHSFLKRNNILLS